MKILFGLLLGIASLGPTHAFAQQESLSPAKNITDRYAALLAMPRRPTMAQFLKAMGPLPDENPFKALDHDTKVESLEFGGPAIIAALEFAYPGAVWAPLGRDSSLMGDLLEAYYLTQKQKNRVVRLDASTASFQEKGLELPFLVSAGLLKSPNEKTEKKWVILDPTSWRLDNSNQPFSQIRKLISAYTNLHADAESKRMVGAVGLGTSSGGPPKGPTISPTTDVQKFLKDVSVRPIVGPDQILYVDDSLAYLTMNSRNKTEVAWHGTFGPLLSQPDGSVKAEPGALAPVEHREHILYLLFEVAKAVNDPSFHETVQSIARSDYRYDFEQLQRADLASIENEARFESLMQKRWDKRTIINWIEKASFGLPNSMSGLLAKRILMLAASGHAQNLVTTEELTQILTKNLPFIETSADFSEFIVDLLEEKKISPGSAALVEILKTESFYQVHSPLLLRALRQSAGGLTVAVKLNKGIDFLQSQITPSTMPVKEIIGLKASALKYATSAEDYMKIFAINFSNPNTHYLTAHFEFVRRNISAAIQAGLTFDQLTVLKAEIPDVADGIFIMEKSMVLVKSAEDFFRVIDTGIPVISVPYKNAISDFIISQIPKLLQLGISLDQLNKLKPQIKYIPQLIQVMERSLPLVKNSADFFKVIESGYSPTSSEYQTAISKFAVANIDKLISPKMTLKQALQIQRNIHDPALLSAFLNKVLPLIKTTEDYLKIIDLGQNPTPEIRAVLTKFQKDHLAMAFNNSLTAEQVSQLRGDDTKAKDPFSLMERSIELATTLDGFFKAIEYGVQNPSSGDRDIRSSVIAAHLEKAIHLGLGIDQLVLLISEISEQKSLKLALKKSLPLITSFSDYMKVVDANQEDSLKGVVDDFILRNFNKAVELNVDFDQINQMKKKISTVVGTISLMEAAIPLVKTHPDFQKLMDPRSENPSPNYIRALNQFRKEHSRLEKTLRRASGAPGGHLGFINRIRNSSIGKWVGLRPEAPSCAATLQK